MLGAFAIFAAVALDLFAFILCIPAFILQTLKAVGKILVWSVIIVVGLIASVITLLFNLDERPV